MGKRKKAGLTMAALLLSETAACVPICDPVPPPPFPTSIAQTATAGAEASATARPTSPRATPSPNQGTPGQPPPICDPVPPPPYLTAAAATRAATAPTPTRTPTPSGTALPRTSATQKPDLATLPLQRRLTLRILPVKGERFVYTVEANFPTGQVTWLASGGVLEQWGAGVQWLPPPRPGRYLIQAVVDAGPLGVAVDSLAVTSL
ncbi:MAG: hypothetical protein M1401_02905 [Chloroflexi bacterium]|nr:hypothetical protein [Chloroflexota bacterium]MCL5107824.1 hypothetical protein [Chloroflexota bacterium]